MNISTISFLIALVVMTILISLTLKQKAKPIRKQYKTSASSDDQSNTFNVGLVQSKWAEITAMKNSGPSGLKTALFEADKLLDYCMVGNGFKGETMGERLKSGGQQFSNINAVWNAHKLRNELAHNVEHDLVPVQVEQAITSLGNAIRELGVTI